ncbi:MAG: hypothetical protein OXG78_05950 [Chloroflexi bacterium]|nr:hypothetical protein [Chloroflexota bacterium]
MKPGLRPPLLRCIAQVCGILNKHLIFRHPAQSAHDKTIDLMRLLERMPLAVQCCKLARQLALPKTPITVGGVALSQRLIVAAGLVKGDGFACEEEALKAVAADGRNIIPGWAVIPALLGPVEFGSFTRHPRPGNAGTVVWRDTGAQSTQNRVGLRNPGARAAARFLGDRRQLLPAEFGINIAVSPGVDTIDQQQRDIIESLSFFLDAGVIPRWFTLNLSCPNTEDDPQGYQLESETRQLCGAFIACLRSRKLNTPLWVKISPGLASQQYRKLMRIFHELGVRAVIATNTMAKPSPDDDSVQAGVGGGELFPDALDAVRTLLAEKSRMNYAVDVIACGGILDGASFREYRKLGVKAGQYWSALVYRGPFAAAIIEKEMAQHDHEYETVRRESLA